MMKEGNEKDGVCKCMFVMFLVFPLKSNSKLNVLRIDVINFRQCKHLLCFSKIFFFQRL